MQKILSSLSEGINAIAFAGAISMVLCFGIASPAAAQDEAAVPAAGAHEALTGMALDQVEPNGDVIYQNSDTVLNGIPALIERRYSAHVCFVNPDYPGPGVVPEKYDSVGGVVLQDLLTKYLGTDLDHLILMRIERVYVGDDPACGLLEFTYAYKNDIEAAAEADPAPAKKKK